MTECINGYCETDTKAYHKCEKCYSQMSDSECKRGYGVCEECDE